MKIKFHKILAITFIVTMLVHSVNAFAVDSEIPNSTVTYTGGEASGKIELSTDDFFIASKGMMPGDTSHQRVTFKNRGKADIRIFLRAEYIPLNDEVQNKVALDLAMNQINMKLTYPTTENNKVVTKTIYEGKMAGAIDKHGNSLMDKQQNKGQGYVLGRLSKDANMEMNVEITIPEELGNVYQNAVSKIKWVFVIEDFYQADEEEIPDDDIPLDAPQTGDDSLPVIYTGLIVAGSSICVIIFALLLKRKKKNTSNK